MRTYARTENWCNEHEQSANTEKTQLMLFTRKRSVVGFKAPIIFGKEILLSGTVKILGATLDPKLNWNFHIQNRI